MKRIGLILIAILIMAFPLYSQNVTIPDTAFLYALIDKGVDTNGDSLISYGEAEAVSYYLVLYSSNISSVTGIEAFGNLDSLNCVKNLLTSLDVSENTALTYLNCRNNQLSSIDVSNNTALSYLYCAENQLTSLDVSNCTALTYLSCGWNELTSLNASNCTALTYLNCHSNLLTRLDVSNNTALTELFCHSNQLTSLDVSNNTFIETLGLSGMTSLIEVCVWEMPFPPSGVNVDTNGSPNVYFTTDCATGLREYKQDELNIYPNPANDLLTFETDQSEHYSIQITSLNGQSIFTCELEGTIHQIDLSSFQKGVYIITIRSQDFVTTRKIIKY